MDTIINKKRVRDRFEKALATYDAHAHVQHTMAKKLANFVTAQCGTHFPHVYEIGCGTGLLTAYINNSCTWKTYTANDLAPECRNYIENINKNITFTDGDIENISLPEKRFNLIISNATFQWIEDMPALLEKMQVACAPDGLIAFATFTHGTAREIKEAAGISLHYPKSSEIQEMCARYGTLQVSHHEFLYQSFESPHQMITHFKRTGANALNIPPWTRKDINEFAKRCNVLFGKTIPLTYSIQYIILRCNTVEKTS